MDLILAGTIKQIKVTNSDTDTYGTLTININTENLDLNLLHKLKHKYLVIKVTEDLSS